jgi:type IV pilus assembly protein PilP
MSLFRRLQGVLLVAVLQLLGGCDTASDADLRQWMAEQRNQTRPSVAPLAEPKQFRPEPYKLTSDIEPFSNQKLTTALRKDSPQTSTKSDALLTPELARRKEPLEEFPLDTMALVGTMSRAGKPVALVTVGKLLYQVRTGDHLGQNYGLVTKISETEVTLREIAQDAVGEWIERTASLQLQERSK